MPLGGTCSTIRKVTVAGPGGTIDTNMKGSLINADGCTKGVTIEDVELQNEERYGIFIQNSKYVHLARIKSVTQSSREGLTTAAFTTDIVIGEEVYDSDVKDSILAGPSDIGIYLGPVTNDALYTRRITVENNTISGHYYGAIIAYAISDGHSSDHKIIRNTIFDISTRDSGTGNREGGFGIYLQQAHRNIVQGNHITNVLIGRTDLALGLGAITDNVGDSLIEDNEVSMVSSLADCIWIETSIGTVRGGKVTGNNLSDCGRDGIYAGSVSDFIIANNTILQAGKSTEGTATTGLGITATNFDGLVVDNNISAGTTGYGGLFAKGRGLNLSGNQWRYNSEHGLVISAVSNVIISDQSYNNSFGNDSGEFDGINVGGKSTFCTLLNSYAYDDQINHTQYRGVYAPNCKAVNTVAYGNISTQSTVGSGP